MAEYKPCPHCGSTKYYMTVDKRGVPEVRCAECDCFIVKAGTQTLNDYYVERLANLYKEFEEKQQQQKALGPAPCKYCTERWAILSGRMGIRPREMNDIKYCPMCGRELKPEDKNY